MKTLLKVLVGLVILVVVVGGVVGILTWAPDRPVESLKGRWAPPPSQFVDVMGTMVHYRDVGPKDDLIPIVMIHGLSSSLHTWEGWVQALKVEHHIVSVDLPGSGLTGPNPKKDYSIEADTKFMLDFLKTIAVHRCILVGNSYGGSVAWHVALAEPLLVDKLVLVDAVGYPVKSAEFPPAFRFARFKSLQWFTEHFLPRRIIEASVNAVYGDTSRIKEDVVDRYYELSLRAGNRSSLIERLAKVNEGADAAGIKNIAKPTLILWGKRDKLIPPENAELFHRDIAGSEVVMYDDLGHVPQEEDPVRTAADVRRFLLPQPADAAAQPAAQPATP